MADALCGPSNALQKFKQHTQVDRSLQQDRLTGPRTPIQSFRTQDPRTGSLDAEFHAFENATANPFQEPFVGNNFPPQAQFQRPVPSNWANDFQYLNISDQPLPVQQFRSYAPLVKSTNGGWQNEFVRQQQGGMSVVAQGKQAAFDQQNMVAYNPQIHYQGGFAPMTPAPQTEMHQTAQAQMTDQTIGADWSAAFEEAFQDAFKEAEQSTQLNAQESSMLHEDGVYADDHSTDIQQPEQIRIGSDAINYTEMKGRTSDQESQDANALARVAGELLHNVQHDSSEKFQNSQFLDLMRKIRDREVEVRNNDFEMTGSSGEAAVQPTQSFVSTTDQVIRTVPDPVQDQDTFVFPDMDAVHAPREADFVDYSFDSDQFPSQPNHRHEVSDLHPGGKLYPGQSPVDAQMSGAVKANDEGSSKTISAADFIEAAYGEFRDAFQHRRSAA